MVSLVTREFKHLIITLLKNKHRNKEMGGLIMEIYSVDENSTK